MKIQLTLLIAIILSLQLKAQNFNSNSISSVANYISSLQYTNTSYPSYGSIKKSIAPNVFSNQLYFAVEPYFSHIGALGMLESDHPDKCNYVLRWMNWYINHINSKGLIFNYYYSPDGSGETTCPPGATGSYCNHLDAEDSDPALFWILINQYYLKTSNQSFFTPAVKLKLENSAQFVMDSLIQSDNLSIAKRTYPVKYTMDNSELYKGLLSLSNIESIVFNDNTKALLYLNKANAVKNAVQTLLFNNTKQLYDHSLGSLTDTTMWYNAGIAATIWPQLFGIDTPNSANSKKHRQILQNNFNGTLHADWTTYNFINGPNAVDAFPWASIGYAFSLANDTVSGYKQASYISSNVFVFPFNYPPCYVADAGWVILNMSKKYATLGCIPTSISPQEITISLNLYPNPVNASLTISGETDEITNMKIYNSLGELILSKGFSNVIDVFDFPNGVYTLHFMRSDNTKKCIQKIIISR